MKGRVEWRVHGHERGEGFGVASGHIGGSRCHWDVKSAHESNLREVGDETIYEGSSSSISCLQPNAGFQAMGFCVPRNGVD